MGKTVTAVAFCETQENEPEPPPPPEPKPHTDPKVMAKFFTPKRTTTGEIILKPENHMTREELLASKPNKDDDRTKLREYIASQLPQKPEAPKLNLICDYC